MADIYVVLMEGTRNASTSANMRPSRRLWLTSPLHDYHTAPKKCVHFTPLLNFHSKIFGLGIVEKP
jgi:muramidase (phage lysozyme)